MQTFFLTLLLLASHGACAAAGLPAKAQTALDAALHARGVKDAAGAQAAAESAYKEGASAAELKAFLEQAPLQAPAAELEKGLTDMAGLLKEGLEDREARKAALKALQARLNAKGQHGPSAHQSGSSDDSLRQAQAERREETRRRLGLRGADGDPGPTPVIH
jgi:hypothetical protein